MTPLTPTSAPTGRPGCLLPPRRPRAVALIKHARSRAAGGRLSRAVGRRSAGGILPYPGFRDRAVQRGSGPGGKPRPVEDLDGAVADPDHALAFQVFEHLVQRGPLRPE